MLRGSGFGGLVLGCDGVFPGVWMFGSCCHDQPGGYPIVVIPNLAAVLKKARDSSLFGFQGCPRVIPACP